MQKQQNMFKVAYFSRNMQNLRVNDSSIRKNYQKLWESEKDMKIYVKLKGIWNKKIL